MLYQEASKNPEKQICLRKRFLLNSMLYHTSLWTEIFLYQAKNTGLELWLRKCERFGEQCSCWSLVLYVDNFVTCMFWWDQFQKSVSRRVVVANPVSLFPMIRLSLYFLPLTIMKREATGEHTSNWILNWFLGLCSTKSASTHAGRIFGRGKAVCCMQRASVYSLSMWIPATNLQLHWIIEQASIFLGFLYFSVLQFKKLMQQTKHVLSALTWFPEKLPKVIRCSKRLEQTIVRD